MHIFHKWLKIKENDKWLFERCGKCGFERWVEKFLGGYQPRP